MSNGRESLQHENDLKTILLGIQGVGKTNLIKIATGRKFEEEQNSTLSVSFFEKNLSISYFYHFNIIYNNFYFYYRQNDLFLFLKNTFLIFPFLNKP